jgi:hypothetical protein
MNDESHPDLDNALLAWCEGGEWRVLGRKLKPISLLHMELLRMVGSGMVTGGKMNLPELDLAARICSMEPWAAGRWLSRRRRSWRGWESLRFTCLLLRWWWTLPEQWALMAEYVAANLRQPEMMIKDRQGGQGQRRDAPAFLDSWVRLVGAGYPWREVVGIWPASLVGWMQETLASQEGGRKFVTSEDKDLMAKVQAAKAMTDPEPSAEAEMLVRARKLRARVSTAR